MKLGLSHSPQLNGCSAGKDTGWGLGQGCEAFNSCRCGTDVKKLLHGQDSLNLSEIKETIFWRALFWYKHLCNLIQKCKLPRKT